MQQGFPGRLKPEQTDPFLMCDFFGSEASKGVESDPDTFPSEWQHPHRGMDILTYIIEGVVVMQNL